MSILHYHTTIVAPIYSRMKPVMELTDLHVVVNDGRGID